MTGIERRYVEVGDRLVHFRCCGTGPAVVLLHDSPRSSRLHLDTMRHLGRRFRVYALDTPGYGNSSPLDLARPTIEDFGTALGQALAVLGLEHAPLYATHTSAKIALAYAAAQPLPPRLILDGLSIPTAPPDPAFIDAYMRPFRIEGSGGYLASEWTRVSDMLRWFPWFDLRPATRMAMPAPSPDWISDYVIDLFSAGPHYSDAYSAAMYYDPAPALGRVTVPTLIAARADDVLYPHLDRVPVSANSRLSVERLSSDRGEWLQWLEAALDQPSERQEERALVGGAAPGGATFYVDLPHGQMRVHRAGPPTARPLLILSAPTTRQARRWQQALAGSRATLVPELPGFGESDALVSPDAQAFADALAAMLAAISVDNVDVLAIDFAVPLALMLAVRHPRRVARIALDGSPPIDGRLADAMAERLCPPFPFDVSGAHVHRIWHMLRDAEVQWPWFDSSGEAARTLPPDMASAELHRALTELLKQPAHYGDAASAALRVSKADLYSRVTAPVLLFDHPDDPAYRWTGDIAESLLSAQRINRQPDLADNAPALNAFLASAMAAPASHARAGVIHA
jgi:pimeloyl-ACP methyl ester carboxylesterase